MQTLPKSKTKCFSKAQNLNSMKYMTQGRITNFEIKNLFEGGKGHFCDL